VQKFVHASLKGWDYALKHPEEIIQLILKKYNTEKRLSAEHLRFEAAETAKMIVPSIIPLGNVNTARFQRIAELYLQLGMVKSLENLAGFVYPQAETVKLKLSQQEIAWLQAHPLIRMAIDKDFPPYESTDSQGHFIGLSADYIALVEQRLGIKFKVISNKPWAEMLEMAKKGEIDLLPDIVQTSEREQYLLFTESYLDISAVIVSVKNKLFLHLDDLRGKRVAVESSYFMYEVLNNNRPEIQVIPVKNTVEALIMVDRGKVDAYIGDAASTNYVIGKLGMTNLFSSNYTDYKNRHRMATIKANPLLKSILNKALADVSENEKQTIQNRWLGLEVKPSLETKDLFRYGIAMLLVFVVIMLWNMSLQRQIKRRRQIERALYKSEELFRNIFENAPLGVATVSLQQRYIMVNQAYCDILGYSHDELLCKSIEDLTSPEDQAQRRNLNNKLLAGELSDFRIEKKYIGKNNQPVWTKLYVRLIRHRDGSPHYYLTLIENINERKIAEQYEKFHKNIMELLVSDNTLHSVLTTIVQGIEQLNPSALCSILLLDNEGKHLIEGIAPSLPDFYNAAINGIQIGEGVGSMILPKN
jgi:PAS domain S-box-containing protein